MAKPGWDIFVFLFSSFSKAFPLFSFLFHISIWCGGKSLRTLALGEEISNHTEVNDTILDVRKLLAPVLPARHPPPTVDEKEALRDYLTASPQGASCSRSAHHPATPCLMPGDRLPDSTSP